MTLLKALRRNSEWPVVQQLTMLLFFLVGIILARTLPGVTPGVAPVQHEEWFLAGIITELVATVSAFVIGFRKNWWHLRWILGILAFLAVALLLTGVGAVTSVLIEVTLGPVLLFARREGRFSVAIAGAGSFFALVIPALLADPTTRFLGLFVALSTSGMFTVVALSVRRVMVAQRERMEGLRELVTVRDEMLRESREYTSQLERSEVERSTAERTLRGVWQAVTEQAMITTDLSGSIEAWNPGAEKLIGLRAENTEHQRNVVDFLEPDELAERARERGSDEDEGGFATLVGSAMDGGAEAADWNVVSSDARRIPVHLTVTARLTETGERVGYMFVAHDLTEARAVAKLKDEFVSLISHELRTPLSSIIGYLEILRDADEADLTATQLQYIAVAERNAHRLLRLVGDLLFTAQVESGTFHLEAQQLELGPILTASAETAGPAAANGKIELQVEVVPGVMVHGDPVRLSQAIDNLLSNAIKFTPRDGRVAVSLGFDDTVATITVSDTGMGIPADEMDKLFGRFFRATTATGNAVAGVGLGLTITRAIVLAHGGSMAVESEVGVGTRFTMTVPLDGIRVPAELVATPA